MISEETIQELQFALSDDEHFLIKPISLKCGLPKPNNTKHHTRTQTYIKNMEKGQNQATPKKKKAK